MLKKLRKLLKLTALARRQSVSMQRKLMLYWVSMAAVLFGVLLLIFSITGVFSNADNELRQTLEVQLRNTAANVSAQVEALEAYSIDLSEHASREIAKVLPAPDASISVLNDQPELLLELQRSLYGDLSTTLQVCDCSGAFIILDATTNTRAPTAASSRTGLYLRFANLSTSKTADQDVVYFRGMPEISREEKLEMHNRWNLEFDTSLLPFYQQMLDTPVGRLANACRWTDKLHLTDTWEDAILLCAPVLDGRGDVCGVCGVEISGLYFSLSYPTFDSQFGPLVSVLAPVEDGRLRLDCGLAGGTDGTYLGQSDALAVREGRYFNTYTTGSSAYVGVQQSLSLAAQDGRQWDVAILTGQESYTAFAAAKRTVWIASSLGFLLLMLALSFFLSHRFVRPIARSLEAVWSREPLGAGSSGIYEIDSLVAKLVAFMQSEERNQPLAKESLPPDIAELFDAFAERAAALTTAERGILQYYIEGREISEIPGLAYISISTVRKHNRSIYEKLNVASRDELMLYIELFRRCGRLDELC